MIINIISRHSKLTAFFLLVLFYSELVFAGRFGQVKSFGNIPISRFESNVSFLADHGYKTALINANNSTEAIRPARQPIKLLSTAILNKKEKKPFIGGAFST